MSTLISDLDSSPGGGDGDFVQSILNEINAGGGGGGGGGYGGGGPPPPAPSAPIQAPPVVGGYSQGSVIIAPNPNTMAPHVMDSAPATAHMIGNSHPTPADFAQMMGAGGGGGPVMAAGQGMIGVAGGAAQWSGPVAAQPYVAPVAKRSWLSRTLDEFRTPFFVVILVFVFSLPVVNFLFAHYLPRMVKPTGELTIVGLLIKSFAAGGAFWVLHRVIVPLLSL